MKRTCAVLLVSFFSFFCLLSCGLESFYYIDNIPYSEIQDTVSATIMLPSSGDEGYGNYFTHFIIFYRIYISDMQERGRIAEAATNNVNNKQLNTALNSDFSNLYSYTDKTSTNVSTANLENTFLNRKYFKLELEGRDIINVLGIRSLGRRLTIQFDQTSGVRPTLILENDTPYNLLRDKDSIGVNASPVMRSRNFLNHPDLYNPANAVADVNADVAKDSKPNADFRYTYVSMYIAATGKSYELPPRSIYSQPTFIGVFRLAESS